MYATQMGHLSYGHALYKPVSTGIMHPGSAGFLDENGNWTSVFDITDKASLSKAGLETPSKNDLEYLENGTTITFVDPWTSDGLTQVSIDASLEIPVPNAPVTLGGSIKYESKKDFGAVLVVTNPVENTKFKNIGDLRKWVQQSWSKINNQSYAHSLHKNGLIIVHETYSTSEVSITAKMGTSSSGSISMDIELAKVVDGKGNVEWKIAKSSAACAHYRAKVGCEVTMCVDTTN